MQVQEAKVGGKKGRAAGDKDKYRNSNVLRNQNSMPEIFLI